MTNKTAKATATLAATPAPCIVAIGASAGGLEALRQFFQAMPADTGVAFLVVQHLDPKHASLTAELLAKETAMPVAQAVQGGRILPNHIYTVPSDQGLTVDKGRLRLSPRVERGRLWLPIDLCFNSVADDCGARGIGVVLSGAGSDGALGVRAIAGHGGMVLVQDPASAGSDGMPRSAIATGAANHVLGVAKMPEVIAAYARHPYVLGDSKTELESNDERATQQLIKLVQARRGYDFSGYKRSTLLRRIERRMGLRAILRRDNYVTLLKRDALEVDALFRDLLIGVTEFFRDPEAWQVLDTAVIAPLVAARANHEPIRIWVPGCSTGEEAYTIAMLVLDRLRRARKHCPVQIFATDANEDALEVGRMGRYPLGIAAHLSAAQLKRYFVKTDDRQHFTVSEALRATVVFGLQNLFADPPFGRVDLISCRNVLIYLEPEVQKRVLNIFHFALRKDAHLLLGSAESNGGRDDMFQAVSKKWRIFHRIGSARMEPMTLASGPAANLRHGTQAQPSSPVLPSSLAATVAQKLLLDHFVPAAILLNSQCEALYFCGPTDEFLMRPRGAPTLNVLTLVREGLRSRLQTTLREAVTQDLPATSDGATMKQGKGFVPVLITVTPVQNPELGRVFLVVFQFDLKPAQIPLDQRADMVLVRHLEEDLQLTRDELQDTIERYEATHDNLRLSNEEVITANEELRSLNEELESSKEELQSLNEELTMVNQQLEAKLRELEVANADLNNLLNSSDVATLCLDSSLRIKWFAPATQKQFNFIAADIGRPVSDVAAALGDATLLPAARLVLARQPVSDLEFQVATGRWYIRRVLPYRTEAEQISGVIVTYTDITESRQAMAAAIATRRDLSDSMAQTSKLRALSAALALAEERERRALARDLHDDLGQLMAVIAVKAAVVQRQKMTPALKRSVDECAGAVDLANRKLRTMALQLNPPMLDQLGLVPALEWMADEMRQTYQIEVQVQDDGAPKPMDPAVSATLFRAVRELLINVARHAKVRQATVQTACNPAGLLDVTVRDAGAGFDVSSALPALAAASLTGDVGVGLLGVRERIGYLGGEMQVNSAPGEGTSVLIRVPLLPALVPVKKPRTRRRT